MVCVNCGKNLIRGYAFCMECGSPVPPEVLEEGGMPGRTDDEGRPKPEAESVQKTENSDNNEKTEKPVSEVRSSMPGIEPLNGGDTEETLVFCPNCGMHMQSDPYRCNICGKKLIDKPKNVPLSAGGVPLMNVNLMAGMGGIGGGLDGISDSDIEQISSFMSGTGNIPIFAAEEESTPDLFGSDISANDFAALSEQLAIFSAANEMPGIEAIDPPKHEPKTEKPSIERRVDDFNMGGDSAAAALSDNSIPVIGNYSMDEMPEENINLDPYKFLDASMEDATEAQSSKPQTVRTPPPAPVKEPEPEIIPEPPVFEPVFSQNKPVEPPEPEAPVRAPEPVPQTAQTAQTAQAPKTPEPPVFPEIAPVIEETAPVISEFVAEQPAPQAPPAPKAPETANPFGVDDDIFNQPVPPPIPRQDTVTNDAPRGNLFRCQICGQSMYDTDKFCPNCGASYKSGSASPKRKSKAPLFIGIAVAVIVLAAGGFFAMNFLNNGNGGESLPSTSSGSVVADTSEPEESPQTEENTEPDSSESSESTASSTGSSTSTGGASNSSTGAPNSSTGAPPSSTGTPNGSSSSSSTGGPPSSTGAPNGSSSPSSTGGPPSSTGAPNGSSSSSSTGGSSSSAGAPNGSSSSSSTGGSSSSTGAPNSSR